MRTTLMGSTGDGPRLPGRFAPALAALVLVALCSGCGDDFDPASYLDDIRLLALVADPIEAVLEPGAAAAPVTVTSWVHIPDGETIASESWRYCLLSSGPYGGYACAFPEDCEADVGATAQPAAGGAYKVVTLDPVGLGARCLARLAAERDGAEDGAADVADALGAAGDEDVVLDTYLRYRLETTDGAVRDSVLRIPLWLSGAPATANQSPVIERVEIGGVLATTGALLDPAADEEDRAVDVRVLTAPDSVDSYVDDYGREREEEIFVSFYATAGRFDLDREIGVDVTVPWKPQKLEGGEEEAVIWVVARDIRGGQDVAGPFRIPVPPPETP